MQQQSSEELIKKQNDEIQSQKHQINFLQKQNSDLRKQILQMQKNDDFKNLFLAGFGLEKLLDVYIQYEQFIIRPDCYKVYDYTEYMLGKGGSGEAYKAQIKVDGVWKDVCAKIIENDNLAQLILNIDTQMKEANIYLETQSQ